MILHEQITLLSLHLGTSAPGPHVRRDIIERLSDESVLFLTGERTLGIAPCKSRLARQNNQDSAKNAPFEPRRILGMLEYVGMQGITTSMSRE